MIQQEKIDSVRNAFLQLQNEVLESLASVDPTTQVQSDSWSYHVAGGGISKILQSENVYEKGGVNFSYVVGEKLPEAATQNRPELLGSAFAATGISMVIHPHNPYVPTMHANVRAFFAQKPNQETVWWFGGGFDLTPYYGFDEDCQHWHRVARSACEPFGSDLYPKYKKWADDYFYLPHRQEPRGIGGLFFDDLNHFSFETCRDFTLSVANHIIPAYLPIVERRKSNRYGERERNFQLYRRGRYVEFNLLYDRGTLFGLQSKGRTESILMSLPPMVSWQYNWKPEPNTPEAALYDHFLIAKEWDK